MRRALALVIALAGCSGEVPSAGEVVTRDSADVLIVQSSAPMWGPGQGWTLGREPTMTIGGLDGEGPELFTAVVTAFRTRDGRIVVANRRNPPELRVFGVDGQHVVSAGGAGEGPGEMALILTAYLSPPDTLIAYSGRAGIGLLNYYTAAGTFLHGDRIDLTGGPGPFFHIPMGGRFADGTIIGRPNAWAGAERTEGLSRDTVSWLTFAGGAGVVDTIGRFPDVDYFQGSDGRNDIYMLPFARRTILLAHGDVFYVATGSEHRVDVHRRSGELVRSIRRAIPRRPVESADVNRRKQNALDGARDDNQRRQIERWYADIEVPAAFPANDRYLLVDTEDNLWVKDYPGPRDEETRWTVFDGDGQWLGAVSMPLRFRATDIGSDYVLGVFQDELDVEHVQLWRLSKTE